VRQHDFEQTSYQRGIAETQQQLNQEHAKVMTAKDEEIERMMKQHNELTLQMKQLSVAPLSFSDLEVQWSQPQTYRLGQVLT
jgi:K+/H+ antiporter YhaU regulatory subunit KhtT